MNMNHVVVDPVKMDLYAFVLKDACDEFFEVDVAERILRPIFLTPGKGAAACTNRRVGCPGSGRIICL